MSVFKRLGSPYYVYDFLFRGRRCRGSTKLTNKIAAQRFENNLRERLAKQRAGILDPEPPPLFKVFADQFVERTKNQMRPNTSRCYSVSVKNLKPRFGGLRLDEITADGLEKFKQLRLGQGRSPSTVNRDLACMRRILLFAVKHDVLTSTPFVAHKVEFLEENRRERVLTFDEERKKHPAAAGQPLHDVATIMLELGFVARRGICHPTRGRSSRHRPRFSSHPKRQDEKCGARRADHHTREGGTEGSAHQGQGKLYLPATRGDRT